MADIESRLAGPADSRARIVSIFVGAVLLPSVALSILSFRAVPKQAESLKLSLKRGADQVLAKVEQDLETAARAQALKAARAVGADLLLDGRPRAIRAALKRAGLGDMHFDSLRLEAWSPAPEEGAALGGDDVARLRDALRGMDLRVGREEREEEDAVPLTSPSGEQLGVVRFRFSSQYVQKQLMPQFFEHELVNRDDTLVIRVSQPDGDVVFETAPTPDDRFEVRRTMTAPSFEGLKLSLRFRDRSIEQEVRRQALVKTGLIGFIDLMLGAGLYLVFANVRRELRLSRLKSDFVANVSHELKTPLALIRLFSETLELGRVPSDDKARQYYRVINKESQRLTQLINNILDFSRIEAGRKEYRFARTDVGAVVRDVVEAYRFPIEQQGFQFDVQIADDLPEAVVDPEALAQALLNLVNNAIKYSSDEHYVGLDVRRSGDDMVISVTDRGVGIPKAEQRRIFEKFYRVENTLVHTTKGSGLGLALVQHIMEAHGGRVELTSAPGAGSTFRLVLPLEPEGRRGGTSAQSASTLAREAAGEKA
jgi:signal transduction histidine kinase